MDVPPPPPPTTSVPPPPPAEAPAAQAAPERPPEPAMPNPGPYTDMHREAKGVFSFPYTFFDGVRLQYMRGVSQNMQVSHNINLGGSNPPGYHFAPTYVGGYKPDPEDPGQFPICISDIDNEGNLRAQLIHTFNNRLSMSFNGQSKPKGDWVAGELSTHYKGDTWQANLTAVNPKASTGEGIGVLSMLQKVTENFTMGGEFLYQAMGGHIMTGLSFAGRYRCPDFTACATMGMTALGLSYHQKIDDKTEVATEMDVNLMSGDATATFGYNVNLKHANVKAQIDSKGRVACGIEQEVLGPQFVMQLSGLHDHGKDETKIGIGLRVQV